METTPVTAVPDDMVDRWPETDEARAVGALRDAGYAVAPGSLFRLSSPPGIRVTVATLDAAEVEPVADAVARALRPGGGFTA